MSQSRRYRVELHDQDGEVGISRKPMVVLDLTTGAGMEDAQQKLGHLLLALARQDPTHDITPHDYHLAVYDAETGEFQFDWLG
jgi:hypothetical protein